MIDTQLVEYIHSALSAGRSKEELYKELLAQNISIDTIQAACAASASPVHQENSQKHTVRVVVTLGALSVGLGIISFIAANWQGIGPVAKVAIILLAMVAAYVLGWLAEHKYSLPKTAHALYFLGVLIYGGGIFLVAQIFNVQAHWPDGFMLWMLGALATAFAVESFLLFYTALLLAIIALTGAPFFVFGFLSGTSFLLTSTLLLLVAAGALFFSGLTLRNRMPEDIRNLL